jgi:two-component system OmpR family response regulator
VLRRTLPRAAADAAAARAYRFAGWRLDLVERSLTSPDGQATGLSGAEFRLLAHLLASSPGVVSRADLMEALRGREHDPFDRSIDVRVSRLRQVLGDDARAPRIVKTVYGEGYIIGVPVEKVAA